MIVSEFGFQEFLDKPHVTIDPTRIAAQVVSGIGFLGAGTILLLGEKVIRGLTTAASLWTIAGVGLAVGCGLFFAAVAATVISFLILAVLKPFERRYLHHQQTHMVTVRLDPMKASLADVEAHLKAAGLQVAQVTFREDANQKENSAQFVLARPIPQSGVVALAEKLKAVEGVREVSL